MLMLASNASPSTRMGCFRLARNRSAIWLAVARSAQGRQIPNSSPPSRATMSDSLGAQQVETHLLPVGLAVVVAEGVVDLLEAIQVEQQQRERCVLVAAGGDGLLHVPLQEGAIGQPGQQIMRGLVGQLVLGSPRSVMSRTMPVKTRRPSKGYSLTARSMGKFEPSLRRPTTSRPEQTIVR